MDNQKYDLSFEKILCEPTLVVPDTTEIDELFVSSFMYSLQGYSSDTILIDSRMLSDALESYLRTMISQGAREVCVPSYSSSSVMKPNKVKSMLADSTRQCLTFVDKRQAIWNAVRHYLRPVKQALPPGLGETLSIIAWDIYRLSLSTKYSCDVILKPDRTIKAIEGLESDRALGSEERTRLARIKGIFRLYRAHEEVPKFFFIPAISNHCISERIDEILEDAYLLEASRLRRFFGVGANKAAIKRDLTKIMGFISHHRPWAKGIVRTTSQIVYPAAENIVDVLENLLNGFLGSKAMGDKINPILVYPDQTSVCSSEEYSFQAQRILSDREPDIWTVRIE